LAGLLSGNSLGQAARMHVPLSPSSIIYPLAGKVTAGLAESYVNLPPGGWLKVTCVLTVCIPESAQGPTLGNEHGKIFTL